MIACMSLGVSSILAASSDVFKSFNAARMSLWPSNSIILNNEGEGPLSSPLLARSFWKRSKLLRMSGFWRKASEICATFWACSEERMSSVFRREARLRAWNRVRIRAGATTWVLHLWSVANTLAPRNMYGWKVANISYSQQLIWVCGHVLVFWCRARPAPTFRNSKPRHRLFSNHHHVCRRPRRIIGLFRLRGNRSSIQRPRGWRWWRWQGCR